MASLQVENQCHTARMLHSHAKEDPHARSDLPLVQFLTRLHLVVKDKHRTKKTTVQASTVAIILSLSFRPFVHQSLCESRFGSLFRLRHASVRIG